jgi:hypothetical protein
MLAAYEKMLPEKTELKKSKNKNKNKNKKISIRIIRKT